MNFRVCLQGKGMGMGILDRWQVTWEDLNEVIETNPSLRGMVFGYVAEQKLRSMWFSDPRFSNVVKYRNHDRMEKGDIGATYREKRIRVESKSLQTATIKNLGNGNYTAEFQCDASDKREVIIVGYGKLQTTCLMIDQFDLLAVNLFAFGFGWEFAFARNKDLPRSRSHKYPPEVQQMLLSTNMAITWPLRPPYESEPYRLLDEIVQERILAGL